MGFLNLLEKDIEIKEFLKKVILLDKKINKFQSKKVEMSKQDVRDIIEEIKQIYHLAVNLETKLKNENNPKTKFYLKIMVEKIDYIKKLYVKIKIYEKQLGEFEKIIKK